MKRKIEENDDFIIISGDGQSSDKGVVPEPEEAVIYYEGRQEREYDDTPEQRQALPHDLPVEKDTEFEIDMDGRSSQETSRGGRRSAKRNRRRSEEKWEITVEGDYEDDDYEEETKEFIEYTEEQEHDDAFDYAEDEEDSGYYEYADDEEEFQSSYDNTENGDDESDAESKEDDSEDDDGTADGIDVDGQQTGGSVKDKQESKHKRKGRRKWHLFGGDPVLWIIIIALLIFSIFVTFSAQIYKVSDPIETLIQQFVFIGIGIASLWLVHIIKYQFYRRVAKLVWWTGIILTFAAWLYGKAIGAESTRDIALFGISFQPLEILKTGMVMLLAMQLAGRQKNIDRMKILPSLRPAEWKRNAQENIDILTKQTIPLLGPILLTCILSFLAVGNSTTLIIGATCFVMLFIGRARSQDLWKIIGIGVLGGIILLISGLGRSDTGQSRLAKFSPDMYHKHSRAIQIAGLDGGRDSLEVYSPPIKGYDAEGKPITESEQAVTAKMAVASGEILGKGPGMSTLRSELPEAEKDYAYAFLVEEYGALGGLLIMLLYLWLFFRTIQIFKRCGTAFPSLLILGLGVMITVQAIMHMMVTVGLFPVAGQQLPLISKGGSSLVFTLFSLGLILGVSRQTADNTLDRPKGESLT